MYSEKLMEHFRNPRNMGKIEDADGIGKVGNSICGDEVYIYIKVNGNRIEDIKFETCGCAAAIGTSSMTTELAKGKTLEDAMELTNEEVVDSLGGLPQIKLHCSELAIGALKAAIEDYKKKN